MKGGLGKGEMCVGCVSGGGVGVEKGKSGKGKVPLRWRALGAPGLRAEFVCNVLRASR